MDVLDAVAWIKGHLPAEFERQKRFLLDVEKIVASGQSNGGCLALHLAQENEVHTRKYETRGLKISRGEPVCLSKLFWASTVVNSMTIQNGQSQTPSLLRVATIRMTTS